MSIQQKWTFSSDLPDESSAFECIVFTIYYAVVENFEAIFRRMR